MPVLFEQGELDSITVHPKPRLQTFLIVQLDCYTPYRLVKIFVAIKKYMDLIAVCSHRDRAFAHYRLTNVLGLPNEDPIDMTELRSVILRNCYPTN
jgi:hypothetical protein